MELTRVQGNKKQTHVINSILKTLVSEENVADIFDGLMMGIEDGGVLYSLDSEDSLIGFVIVTPLESESGKSVELVSIDEIWVQSGSEDKLVAEAIGSEIKRISKEFSSKNIEVIISRGNSWMADILQETGFMCDEIKLEKVLPNPNNLGDVLELIRDVTPIDRIVQVLLEKSDELKAEIIDTVEEIEEQLVSGWVPVIVVVTFEPEDLNIAELIEQSNQVINWDDYSLVYRV